MNTLKFLSQFQNFAPINELLLILSKVTGKSATALLIKDELNLTLNESSEFNEYLSNLGSGVPLPYLLGEWGFYDNIFYVNSNVLIPRPETEQIIDLTLAKFPDSDTKLTILDIGTGSGIIPITLALKYPSANCFGIDLSEEALDISRKNSYRHMVSNRIEWIQADLIPERFTAGQFSLITANLPYISIQDANVLEVFKHEPPIALIGGQNGVEIISRFLGQVKNLQIGFELMLLEIEYRQGDDILKLSQSLFPNRTCTVQKDLAGLDRIITIQ